MITSIYIPYGIHNNSEAIDTDQYLYYYDVYNVNSYLETVAQFDGNYTFSSRKGTSNWDISGYTSYELRNGKAYESGIRRVVWTADIGETGPYYDVTNDGKTIREYYDDNYDFGDDRCTVYCRRYQVKEVTKYNKGSYKYRTTGKYTQYPSNGRSGSYWYVRGGIANSPTSKPGSFSLPTLSSRLQGGKTYTINWGSASDPDGDSIEYYLEFYNGSSWSLVNSNISGSSYSWITPTNIGDISDAQFRVKATDTSGTGNYSSYTYSSNFEIYQNSSPTITVTKPTENEYFG